AACKSAARRLTPYLVTSMAITESTASESHCENDLRSSVSLMVSTSRISASFARNSFIISTSSIIHHFAEIKTAQLQYHRTPRQPDAKTGDAREAATILYAIGQVDHDSDGNGRAAAVAETLDHVVGHAFVRHLHFVGQLLQHEPVGLMTQKIIHRISADIGRL